MPASRNGVNEVRGVRAMTPRAWARHALLLTLAALPAAHADFKVADLNVRVVEGTLLLNGTLELELTRKVEEAVSKGIELPVLIDVRLSRKRAFLWDRRVDSWLLRRSLRYHALSGQYLVGAGDNFDSFTLPADALRHLGTLSDVRLPLTDAAAHAGYELVVNLRVHIDIESLPAPLRPVAYTTLSWHLNSGWTAWDVPH
jgi:hypothetical protein